MYFCEADIKQLGVRNSAHRARIVSSLVAIRDKYENGKNKSISSPLSHLNREYITYCDIAIVRFAIAELEYFCFVLFCFNDCLCVNSIYDLAIKYIQKLSYAKQSI